MKFYENIVEDNIMEIKYDIEIPKNVRIGRRSNSEEYNVLLDFVESNHKTMCLEYEDNKKAKAKVASIRSVIKSRNMDNISAKLMNNKIYILKEEDKENQ